MRIILLLAAAAMIPPGPPAFAAPASDEPTQVVRFSDLDLASKKGLRTLDRRIAAAADRLCGKKSDLDLRGKRIIRRCRQAVIANASAAKVQSLASESAWAGEIRLTLRQPQGAHPQLAER